MGVYMWKINRKIMNINLVYYKLITSKAVNYRATFAHFPYRLLSQMPPAALHCLLSSSALLLWLMKWGPRDCLGCSGILFGSDVCILYTAGFYVYHSVFFLNDKAKALLIVRVKHAM